MDKQQFTDAINTVVEEYINLFDQYDGDAQIQINPVTYEVLLVDSKSRQESIEDSDEAVENAANADGLADETAADEQAMQNPDFFPVHKYFKVDAKGKGTVDHLAVGRLVARYF